MPNIFNVWADEGWEEPVIEERFDPDRTVLALSFKKKQAIKNKRRKQQKTLKKSEIILRRTENQKQVI